MRRQDWTFFIVFVVTFLALIGCVSIRMEPGSDLVDIYSSSPWSMERIMLMGFAGGFATIFAEFSSLIVGGVGKWFCHNPRRIAFFNRRSVKKS